MCIHYSYFSLQSYDNFVRNYSIFIKSLTVIKFGCHGNKNLKYVEFFYSWYLSIRHRPFSHYM